MALSSTLMETVTNLKKCGSDSKDMKGTGGKFATFYNGEKSEVEESEDGLTKYFLLTPRDKVASFRIVKEKNLMPRSPYDNVSID